MLGVWRVCWPEHVEVATVAECLLLSSFPLVLCSVALPAEESVSNTRVVVLSGLGEAQRASGKAWTTRLRVAVAYTDWGSLGGNKSTTCVLVFLLVLLG